MTTIPAHVLPGLRPPMSLVRKVVAEDFGIEHESMNLRCRKTELTEPKHVCFFFGYFMLNKKQKDLALEFGMKGMSGICLDSYKIKNRMTVDKPFRNRVFRLSNLIGFAPDHFEEVLKCRTKSDLSIDRYVG